MLGTIGSCLLAPAASAEDTVESTLPSALVNTSFEFPSVADIYSGFGSSYSHNGSSYSVSDDPASDLYMKSGEAWTLADSSTYEAVSDNRFGWKTTASNGKIELVYDNGALGSYVGDSTNSFKPKVGNQFAELVANEVSSLYQSISTTPGTVTTLALSHSGRKQKESMAVFIGPNQNNYTKAEATDTDIFKLMADQLEYDYSSLSVGMSQEHTFYTKDLSTVDNIDATCVSTVKTTEYDQEWRCWIITDNALSWGTYSVEYTVPEGQTETTFAMTALSSRNSSSGELETPDEGNLLDDITFGINYRLTLQTGVGGSGSAQADNDSPLSIGESQTGYRMYSTGTEVTISAQPDDGYTFDGATINGAFVSASSFTENDGTYTYQVIVDKPTNVYLRYATPSLLIYDPNGGSFKGSTETTVYKFDDFTQQTTETVAPTGDNREFLGWNLAINGEYVIDGTGKNTVIPQAHNISYANNTLTISADGREYTAKTGSTVRLVAAYRFTHKVLTATKYFGSDIYDYDNSTGGRAVIYNITEGGSSSGADTECTSLTGQSIAAKPTAASGFVFDGWFYQDSSGTWYSLGAYTDSATNICSFPVTQPVTIYARFSEVPLDPYLSFVPENSETDSGILQSGTYYNDSLVTNAGEGTSDFGNTIATGFMTKRDFTYSTNSGKWTLILPSSSAYIKKSGETSGAAIADTDAVKINNGGIFSVSNELDTTPVTVNVTLPTTVTGGSAVFGIIIDGIYAPNAQAGFTAGAADGDITLDENNSISAEDIESFRNDSNNIYTGGSAE